MELTRQHNQPAIHPGLRPAQAGVAAPALFALGAAVITWAEWDYLRGLGFTLTDHGDSAWPSGLAQGPVGWAQIVNYAVFGVLLMVFFSGLRGQFRRPRSRRLAGVALTGWAIGWILAAFPEDGPPFGEPSSWAGYLHGVGFVCIVVFGMAAMAATAVALRGNDAWRGYSVFSALAAIAAFFFLFVLVFTLEVATTLGVYGYFVVTVVWVEAMALRLRRLTKVQLAANGR